MRRLLLVMSFLPALAGPALAETLTISQKDKQFSQAEASLKPGDSIRFTNDDSVTHNIAVRDPDGTNHSGVVEAPGADATIPFSAIGDYQVRCLIHPKMKLMVHVE